MKYDDLDARECHSLIRSKCLDLAAVNSYPFVGGIEQRRQIIADLILLTNKLETIGDPFKQR